jgi:glycosyltransferase A (GT-A) superfamily protein (DUF2064 family)
VAVTVLLVIAKAPVAGLAKTRLCPPATPRQAAAIAAAALLDTIDAVTATPGVTPVLAYTGQFAAAVAGAQLRAALAGWRLIRQRGAGLADRLANAHADVAERFPGRPVLQIGMDTPQVRPARLGAAVRRLGSREAVLGPAVDGGWWALGLRDPRHAAGLRPLTMSTADTGRHTRSALVACGLRPAELETLSDVDTWAAAEAVARTVPGSRFAGAVARVRQETADQLPPTAVVQVRRETADQVRTGVAAATGRGVTVGATR